MGITVGSGITIGSGIILGGSVPPTSYPRLIGVDNAWYAAAVGSGTVVLVGGLGNAVARSTTGGSSWSGTTIGISDCFAVIYGDSKFVATGVGDRMAYSSDGSSWSLSSNTVTNLYWTDVAYGAGKFVSVAQTNLGFATNVYAYSSDGITWTTSTLPISGAWTAIIFANSQFVAVSESGGVARSSDGISWSTTSSTGMNDLQDLAYGNGYYVAVRTSGTIYYSTNAVSWTSRSAGTPGTNYYSINFGGGRFIISGGSTGSDKTSRWAQDPTGSWYSAYMPSGDEDVIWHALVYDNSIGWLAAGYYFNPFPPGDVVGSFLQSSDGLIWY